MQVEEVNMKLIIPRISDSTKRRDISDFVNTVLEKIFRLPFSASPKIVSCRVLTESIGVGIIQRSGFIDVTPDDAGLRVIRKLNGKILRGKKVAVKEYRLYTKPS